MKCRISFNISGKVNQIFEYGLFLKAGSIIYPLV